MTKDEKHKSIWCREPSEEPANVTLPPIDTAPEEITQASFRMSPEGEP